jgi:hypothetical protein
MPTGRIALPMQSQLAQIDSELCYLLHADLRAYKLYGHDNPMDFIPNSASRPVILAGVWSENANYQVLISLNPYRMQRAIYTINWLDQKNANRCIASVCCSPYRPSKGND